MNDIEDFFYKGSHKMCQKWESYFPVYEKHFTRLRNLTDLRMLEIGVSQGGSLDIWRYYFGHQAIIVGVDIDESCKRFECARTFVRIGSQEDASFLKSVIAEFGPFDIILDDGGHTMQQQITSFETLYPSLGRRGVYLCEDCHTSYQAEFGGGMKRQGSFIEFAKSKVDELNGWHSQDKTGNFLTDISRSTFSVSFYESVVVFEKSPHLRPRYVEAGGTKP